MMQQLSQGQVGEVGDGTVVVGDVRVKTRFFQQRGDSSELEWGSRAQVEVFIVETMEERSISVIELKDESEKLGSGRGSC